MVFIELCLVVTVVIGLYLKFFTKKRHPRHPPGPPSLPVIGNILQLRNDQQKTFLKWAEEYGDVFSFKIGTQDVIMLNDAKTIKDVFTDPRSAGRTHNEIFTAVSNGFFGLVMGEGPHWEQQRKFTLKTLRDLGFAKTSMEGVILEEVDAMVKYLEKRADKIITGTRIFNGPVINSLWKIMSSEKNDWDGHEAPEILRASEELISALNNTAKTGLMYAPFLRNIAPNFFGWTRWINSISSMFKITNQSIAEHIARLDPNSPQDLIDYYLIEMQNETDPNSSFYKETGERNLNTVIVDLFVAGSESMAATLSWLMFTLAHNQNILNKIQEELERVLGPGCQPSLADRQKLPYTEAVIMEILRRTSVVNSGIPHKMLENAIIHDYFFPKDAQVIANLHGANNNKKVWGDPENFRPERFLSEDGSKVIRRDDLVTFSAGKRVCIGESLSRDTLFIFLACIAQKFHIKPAPGSSSEQWKNTEPTCKLLNAPEPFEIIFGLRK